jgi:hypothetical protein
MRVEALKRIDRMKDRIRSEVCRRRLQRRTREDDEDINLMNGHHTNRNMRRRLG